MIEVTAADASSKAVRNHKECAFARACKRVLHAKAVITCVKTTYVIYPDNRAVRYINSVAVSREVVSFDREAGFEQGLYTLSSVPPSARIGAIRKPGKHTAKGKKPVYHRTENVRHIADEK